MNETLIIAGILILVLAFLIGVKKQTWILSGFNQKRVPDQDKLAKLVGGYNFIIGILLLAGGFINYPDSEKILFGILLIGYVILLGYVNTRMVK